MSSLDIRANDIAGVGPFKVEVDEQLTTLRQALRRLLSELNSPRTPTQLHRTLGVNYAICWQVFKLVRAETNLSSEAANAPSPGSLKVFLTSAAEHGVAPQTIDGVREAADQFSQFIRCHAEDRAAFDSMVAGTVAADSDADSDAEQKAQRIVLQHRRTAYRAMSNVWGLQTDLYAVIGILRRSTTGDGVDTVWMSLQQGVRRLRPDAHITLIGYHKNPGGAANVPEEGAFVEHALNRPAAIQYGMPILPEFSSKPLPAVEMIELASGVRQYEMVGSDIGLRSNFDFAVGYCDRNVKMMVDTDGRRLGYIDVNNNRRPVSMLVMDLLLDRASFAGVSVERMIYQYQEGQLSQEAARRAQQMPSHERVIPLGRADRVDLTEAPRYTELMRYGCECVGWDLAAFDVFRLRVPFPVMGASNRMFFYEADKPATTADNR